MAGAANNERGDAFIVEVTPGTTPATPGFTNASFDTLQMTANPRLSESFPSSVGGERAAIGRNGIAVAGSAQGKLIYGEYDPFFESLFQNTFSTNVVVNGKSQQAMTIEQSIPQGAGGALAYTRFRGVEVVSGQIAITAGQDVTVSFDLLGTGSDASATAIIAGATYTDPTETDIIGSGADIGTISLGTLDPADCIRSLTIDFGVAEKDEQPRVSSDDACGINRGAMRPVITGEFYIEDNFTAIYDAARTGTDFILTVPIGSVTTKKYELYFPACQFVEAPLSGGDSGPAFQTFRILPKYDSGIGGTCRLTRAIA